jgi:hypothetical protein
MVTLVTELVYTLQKQRACAQEPGDVKWKKRHERVAQIPGHFSLGARKL